MKETKQFDLLDSPLEGTNLTEASAGTGKTYTIAGLFVRLILERHLAVDEILVVTFTEAATEELKDRIRRTIRRAIKAFGTGRSEDDFFEQLVAKRGDSELALKLLKEALCTFDKAAIFTIHGFCRRMLHDHAFESSSLFDTELIPDQEALKREVVDDFWRKQFCSTSPLFVRFVLNKKVTPAALLKMVGNTAGRPYLKIIPDIEVPGTSGDEKAFRDAFHAVQEAWKEDRQEVEDILLHHEGLHRGTYRVANVPGWVQKMDCYLDSEGKNSALFKGFEKFTAGEIGRRTRNGCSTPESRFFDLCETLKQKQEELDRIFHQRLLGLKVRLFAFVREELAKRKAKQNVQSFDDLLLRLHGALQGQGGEKLASSIRTKFRAALIDEFQDTDPVQYEIFYSVFGHEESILFLIGDPKQAIYGFRGADVFAYMKASKKVRRRYTLKENWRSEPGLVAAVNTLFGNAENPFVYDDIPFHPVAPAKKKDSLLLTMDGKSESPLQLWFVDTGKTVGPGAAMKKTLAREIIPPAVAGEISRLLDDGRKNKVLIGNKGISEADIAVLVRTNAEGSLIQQSLAALHIPSVLYTTGNLFDSHEALEVERVLAAVAEPNREQYVKTALSTDMMGVKGEELDRLLENEADWESWLVRYRGYHDLWNEHGFIRMFRSLLLTEQVLSRLMSLPDGERRNTNVLHLSEVLHEVSIQKKLGVTGLLKWLAEQRDSRSPRLEEHQLRLESDENAVKVVTIHRSKGLEYPVVFCPFSWDGSRLRRSSGSFMFHDEAKNMQPTLDLGSDGMDRHSVLAEKEQLAENLRLFYVAATRAKHRLYLVWGNFKDADTSAPAFLFHAPKADEEGDIVNAVADRFSALEDDEILVDLKKIEKKGKKTIRVCEMPSEPGRPWSPYAGKKLKLSCRVFSGEIDRSWRVSSFSSLVSGLHQAAETADRDGIDLAGRPPEAVMDEGGGDEGSTDIFSFPKGTKPGTFMHDLFEHLDFSQEDPSFMAELVTGKLAEYGFESTWHQTICGMMQKVLAVPLDPARPDFTLSRIAMKDRLNELEFYFPLKRVSPGKLKSLFAERDVRVPAGVPEHMERLSFAPVRGFMKGFIDMVFRFEDRYYLVDWKSNYLGRSVEDYNQDALAEAMEREFYSLQYHIYALALNQYLKLRVPDYSYDEHFGGACYIFLRGVDPGRGPSLGVYADKPSGVFIQELSRNLIG